MDQSSQNSGSSDNTSAPVEAECPNCGRFFRYDPKDEPKSLPFCCDRCQWVDLGKWLKGDYLISRSLLRDNDEQDD